MARMVVPADQSLMVRVRKHHGFHSEWLSTERDLLVYLPEGYRRNDNRRYPVLYLQDGQNLFDPETAHVRGMDWRVQDSADAGIRDGRVQPLIIVGINHAGAARKEEYTPTRDGRHGGGLGPFYARMLVEEIIPFISRKYRTLAGPHHTGIGGSSLGGLISLYVGFTCPDVFGRIAALSPALWWNRRSILRILKAAIPEPRPKIWLDIGTCEHPAAVRDVFRLGRVLLSMGWRVNEDLAFRWFKGADHSEPAWAKRVGPMLEYLFPPAEPGP